MKKIISLFLVILMIFALVGCNSNKRKIVEVTLSTEDAEAILAAAGITLPDVSEAKGANTTIKWYAWYDAFHNYNEAEIVNTGFFTFKEKYGGEIEWIECEWGARFDGLANLVLAGTAPDFYPASAEVFPSNCIKGIFQPVDDYMDYNDPLWADMKDFVYDNFSMGGRAYLIATDRSFDHVVGYNRRVIDEYGFDDPAELFYNDEWTWNKFVEMCKDFSDPDEDRYALDGWYYTGALMNSTGTNVIKYDTETSKFVSGSDDPRLERAANMLFDLVKNDCTYLGKGRGIRDNTVGAGIKEGQCLFYIVGTWGFTDTVEDIAAVWGDVTKNELMFAPLPRDDQGDGNYYLQSVVTGYCIVNGSENPDAVALLASCDRFKILDPTVISIDRKQLKETYLWTEEMLEMYDICYEIANSADFVVIYGEGVGTRLRTVVDQYNGTGNSTSASVSSWAQIKTANEERFVYYIDELNQEMEAYGASLTQ